MNKNAVIALDAQYYLPVFARYPIVLERGEGPYVYDNEGKKYLDFLAGIAVNLLGHGHSGLVKAVAEQAGKLIHCSNLYYTEVQAALVQKLAQRSGLERVFIANSGAEANEGAMKLARKYGKLQSESKVEIITAQHSFHGRTLATLTATAQEKYQKGYEPLPQGFSHVPFGDLAAMEAAVSAKTCAVLLEPIQGEGGVHVPPAGYLKAVRELCDKHGALLIFDEIQTGVGRTGTFFAYEQEGITPDIVTLAKGLAGGVPIGAFLAKEEVAQVFHAGDHGSTFGGNPLACAAALAVLEAMEQENLLDNANKLGQLLQDKLRQLAQKYPGIITTVRGRGLIVGAELAGQGRGIVEACLEKGIIINCTAGNVLRFVPPLNITAAHIEEVIAVLDSVLKEHGAF